MEKVNHKTAQGLGVFEKALKMSYDHVYEHK